MTTAFYTRQESANDPASWRGDRWATETGWIETLKANDLAEIGEALVGARNQNVSLADMSRQTFPLPTLAARLERLRRDVEDGRGFCLIRGLDPGVFDPGSLRIAYLGIMAYFGVPISQNNQGDLVAEVKDYGEVPPGTHPYKVGIRLHRTSREIGPHCDSSDLVALLCVRPARRGGESYVSSALGVYDHMRAFEPDSLRLLMAGFPFDLVGKGHKGDAVTRDTVPVYSWADGKLSCRFNARQIEFGAEKAGRPLGEAERHAIDRLEELASDDRFRMAMAFRPGDIQVLNNHVILHARGAFADDSGPAGRSLLRAWMNSHTPRPLSERLLDRLNTGARGAVPVY